MELLEDQLDKLLHDIDQEKLDKTGSWYRNIKQVKDDNPKTKLEYNK